MRKLGEEELKGTWSGREERWREGAVDEGSICPPKGQVNIT